MLIPREVWFNKETQLCKEFGAWGPLNEKDKAAHYSVIIDIESVHYDFKPNLNGLTREQIQ